MRIAHLICTLQLFLVFFSNFVFCQEAETLPCYRRQQDQLSQRIPVFHLGPDIRILSAAAPRHRPSFLPTTAPISFVTYDSRTRQNSTVASHGQLWIGWLCATGAQQREVSLATSFPVSRNRSIGVSQEPKMIYLKDYIVIVALFGSSCTVSSTLTADGGGCPYQLGVALFHHNGTVSLPLTFWTPPNGFPLLSKEWDITASSKNSSTFLIVWSSGAYPSMVHFQRFATNGSTIDSPVLFVTSSQIGGFAGAITKLRAFPILQTFVVYVSVIDADTGQEQGARNCHLLFGDHRKDPDRQSGTFGSPGVRISSSRPVWPDDFERFTEGDAGFWPAGGGALAISSGGSRGMFLFILFVQGDSLRKFRYSGEPTGAGAYDSFQVAATDDMVVAIFRVSALVHICFFPSIDASNPIHGVKILAESWQDQPDWRLHSQFTLAPSPFGRDLFLFRARDVICSLDVSMDRRVAENRILVDVVSSDCYNFTAAENCQHPAVVESDQLQPGPIFGLFCNVTPSEGIEGVTVIEIVSGGYRPTVVVATVVVSIMVALLSLI